MDSLAIVAIFRLVILTLMSQKIISRTIGDIRFLEGEESYLDEDHMKVKMSHKEGSFRGHANRIKGKLMNENVLDALSKI